MEQENITFCLALVASHLEASNIVEYETKHQNKKECFLIHEITFKQIEAAAALEKLILTVRSWPNKRPTCIVVSIIVESPH